MIKVNINDNSDASFEKAMKIFKKLCSNDGFISEIRDRRFFKKPSQVQHDRDRQIKNERKRNKSDK